MSTTDVFPVPAQHYSSTSQEFGADPYGQRFPWNATTGGHLGIDWPIPEGTPLYAIADGVVLHADWGSKLVDNNVEHAAVLPDNSSEEGGICIYTDHGDWISCYAHLSRTDLNAGDRIRRGQVIGWSGTTGQSTGPHLHFECILEGRGDLAPGVAPGILWARYDPRLQIDAENARARLAAARASAVQATPQHASAPQQLFWSVDPGDTLAKIAQHYGKTVSELAAHNKISDPGKIQVGQRVLIPGKVIHKITPADIANPHGVAAAVGNRYGVSGEHIMRLNGWSTKSVLRAGNHAWIQKR